MLSSLIEVFVAMACVPGLAEEGGVYAHPRQGGTYETPTEGGIYVEPKQRGTYETPTEGGTYVEPKQGDTKEEPKQEVTYVTPTEEGTYVEPKEEGTFEEPKQSCESTLTMDSNGETIARDFSCLIRIGACTCGVANPSRIVGGQSVNPAHKCPWQVGIKKIGGTNYWCGGTIINNMYVMTAAHCMFNRNGNPEPANLLRVGVADYNMYSTSDDVNGVTRLVGVQEVIIHPQYSPSTHDNDIALLKLQETLDLSKNKQLRAVCLPPNDSKTYAGVMATATGWGTLSSGGQQPAQLYEVSLQILPPPCWGMSGITAKMLCAGYKNGGKDTCQGDSGGPLVVMEGSKYVQVGITSWGYGCANKNSPGVYTRVSKFLSWIRSNTADATYCN